ncbi:MAG: response regulator [Oscillospiraceae bacterium]|nr:response regulator [Oscillospiraceae bacterium]
MKAIAVDDEIYMLENLEEAINASSDIEEVKSFSTCSAALEYAAENQIDVAFLDINMRGIGGLGLAEKLMELHPRCKIIFCTGYEEYAVSAFQLHVSGYLMKPITAEAVQKEIDHIKKIKTTEKLLKIKCFGNFEVLYNGENLTFKRKKAKELLAVLIDRKGAEMTAKQICAILFPDDTDDIKNAAYLRQLVLDLKNTLKTIHAEDVLHHDTPYYRIDTNFVDCDYLSFLESGKPQFHGEYMTQYSWAEETCAMLQFEK